MGGGEGGKVEESVTYAKKQKSVTEPLEVNLKNK